MLARMNFASQLAANQKFNLRELARAAHGSARGARFLDARRLTPPPFDGTRHQAILDYARAGGAWTGSDAQLATKAAGLAHLIVGSGDYQLV